MERQVSDNSLKLLTVTWGADRLHFSLLRESIRSSALANLAHDVIVQDEDLALFQEYQNDNINLKSSRDVLPLGVESARLRAIKWQSIMGRRGTTVCGSIMRTVGRPRWTRFTGWHTQQLCKLAQVAASEVDNVAVLDSDVVVTRFAEPADFLCEGKIVCYERHLATEELPRKVRNWQATAHDLFALPRTSTTVSDGYYDTPFVMHAPTVRALLQWLEQRYQQPWWQAITALPPRRWSEFGIYKTFLHHHSSKPVKWRRAEAMGYLFDASDPQQFVSSFDELQNKQRCHYITLHSQSSGRELWSADSYVDGIRDCLTRAEHQA